MLWRVRQSIPISSKILEGTALSTPSCSTACTNRLCSSGVQSTYTQFKKKKNSFNNPQKLNNITEVEKKKNSQQRFSLSLSLPLPVHDSRDFFASHEVCEERERERERELWDWFPSKRLQVLIRS